MPSFQPAIESQFCTEVNTALSSRDGARLQSILVLEPPFGPIYQQLILSLQSNYPKSDPTSESRLESIIRQRVTETHEGEDEEGRPVASWPQLVSFLATWMSFIRDINIENMLETYERLSELQQKANSALQHATKGVIVLQTLISYAKVFSRVAVGLDKRPELIQHLLSTSVGGEEGRRESLPEKAANILRNAFITCLNDRNTAPGGLTRQGRPDGKKVGIYTMANICLRILFACERLENCQTIFNNIQNNSPPLQVYPASERVTYLYYLGRFHFACTNFFAAQACLQGAYDQCPVDPSCVKQRRLILIYLMGANLLLGRFPTQDVYMRPEARGLKSRFDPLCIAIRRGDLTTFRRITNLDLSHPNASWFSQYKMFYQLGNYCEIYVWRSIFRKVFLLTGKQGESEKSAPTIDLNAVLAAFSFYEKRARMSESMAQADAGPGKRHISFILSDFSAPSTSTGFVDPDFDGVGLKPYIHTYTILEIECICGSLIMQGFLNGYISHKLKKFAIQGTKKAGSALKAGFPNVWDTVKKRNSDEVQGWKRSSENVSGAGTVVRLAGARPAGS